MGRLLRVNVCADISFKHGARHNISVKRDPSAALPTFVKSSSGYQLIMPAVGLNGMNGDDAEEA